jgi:hypothetical protein
MKFKAIPVVIRCPTNMPLLSVWILKQLITKLHQQSLNCEGEWQVNFQGPCGPEPSRCMR